MRFSGAGGEPLTGSSTQGIIRKRSGYQVHNDVYAGPRRKIKDSKDKLIRAPT